jgi:hypothetical protein
MTTTVGDRKAQPVKRNADGTITIYCQNEPPSKDELGNWLPTPKDDNFFVIYRMYCPNPAVFDPVVMNQYVPLVQKMD